MLYLKNPLKYVSIYYENVVEDIGNTWRNSFLISAPGTSHVSLGDGYLGSRDSENLNSFLHVND